MTDDPTKRIGDYEVLGVLGAGGMGKVFKVRNVISDRVEAMKILLPDLAGRQELADRFLREIKLLASLDHPNIAQLRTALTLSNRLVMVMEYVEGTTIADRLEKGPIPPEEALAYVSQVLTALAYAHGRSVIHRDIKPANMMITSNGTVKLMDFGIARASGDQSMTVTGTTVGSLFYMSPEQVKGEGVDFRSDLYSLGVSLYEMVTGERPFKASSDYSLMTAQLQERPKPPSELRPGLPPQLNGIILHSMAKDPAERFQTADEFRQAVDALRQTMPAPAPYVAPVAAQPVAASTPFAPVTPLEAASAAAPPVAATSAFSPDLAPPPPTATSVPLPPVPPAQPAPSVMQMSPPASKGRGLYMALGAVIVLVVLVLAGISLPRMLKTRANEQKPADPGQTSSQPPTGTTTPPADANASANQGTGTSGTASSGAGNTSQPPADSGNGSASSTGTAASAGGNSSGGGAASTDTSASAGAGTPPPPTPKGKGKKAKSTSASTTTASADQGSSAQGASAQGSSGQGSMPTSSDQGQATTDASQKESFEELEQDVDHTSSRAAAANSSLDTMSKQMRSQGLNLRGDIVAAQEAMKINIDKANQALQKNDTKNARRYLDMAQANMEKIEKFLGH